MIHHDGRVRKGAREIGELQMLRVIDHRVEGELARRQQRKALAKTAVLHESPRRGIAPGVQLLIGVPLRDEADAAETSAAGGDLRIERFRRPDAGP